MAQTNQIETHRPPYFRKGVRFYLGIAFFILFLICPAFIPFVLLLPISGGSQAALSAALAIGLPELCAVMAVALLGRESFDYLLRPVKRWLRRFGAPRNVSRFRYSIGLILFGAPLIEAAIFLHSHDWRQLYDGWNCIGVIIWDSLFLSSFFVLGGDFWDKVRALFVYDARAIFPTKMGE